MVSERRPISYAAAVTAPGGSSQGAHPASPIVNSPARSSPLINEQGVHVPQRNIIEDVDNPLYLNSTENANAILVSPLLTGSENYSSWSISMQVALEVKNKWKIVDGSISKPERTHSQYGSWRRCNLIVKSWILKSVHPTKAQSVIYIDEANAIWTDLRRRFSQKDPHRISSLQNQIYELRQGNMSINDYYTKCRILWEEMNALRPLPVCKCTPRCSCGLVDEIRKDREVDQVIRFLQGRAGPINL
ncbi:PREDICTED: uncharacterized protein LOC109152032 [Ipomoea nil]|uniref:uncharacterized protein LOC109152032 n=1 Tax=Ipomoea nil TaxID=35883 RepID=UPI000900A38A|nr:PREDICTED: uncharacterized protein LOC109152032 [Ipomoea nil]